MPTQRDDPSTSGRKTAALNGAFKPGVRRYYGPKNGLSRKKRFPRTLRLLLTSAVSLFCRVEKHGIENLPPSGAHVISPNHVSALDIPIILNLPHEDLRMMINIDAYYHPMSREPLTSAGLYPVNKVSPSPATKRHTINILKFGAGLIVFPEGDFTEEGEAGGIGPFKKGAAAAAILGKAHSIVPIGIHYSLNQNPRVIEMLVAALVAIGFLAVSFTASQDSNPSLAISVVGGALTGAYLGNRVARSGSTNIEAWNPVPKFMATLKGTGIGLIIGAIVAPPILAFDHRLATGLVIAGTLAIFGIGRAWSNRTVARIKIGEPIALPRYTMRAKSDRKGAIQKLTEDLHERIGLLRESLTGVPYDPTAPRVTSARPTLHWRPGVTLEQLRATMADPDDTPGTRQDPP